MLRRAKKKKKKEALKVRELAAEGELAKKKKKVWEEGSSQMKE